MHQSKTSDRKFGSVWRQRKFDEYHAGEQPSGNESNQKATPTHHGEEKDEQTVAPKAAADVAKEHGAATSVHYEHDHEGGNHTVTSTHEDGHTHEAAYKSPAEAYQAGGELSATDVKRREHPDQQGAESEERGYEQPDLA
jgi:hypothetical protein